MADIPVTVTVKYDERVMIEDGCEGSPAGE
jgi:hypothetical protein